MFQRLDVGCGTRATGNVNLDLFKTETEHRGLIRQQIDMKITPNFVLGDALHLPFKTDSFIEVFSNHTIEHLAEPTAFIRECIRVAKEKVVIVCPHRYTRVGLRLHQLRSHRSYFNIKWFEQTLKNYRKTIKCSFYPKPHPFFSFVQLFHEITVTIYLKGQG